MDKDQVRALSENERFSRRNFVKGAALVGGVAALMGVAGCAPAADDTQDNGASDESGGSQTTPRTIVETLECDVLVAGVGIAGLVAAVQAGENNLKVIALEKQGVVGGNGQFTEGVFAVDSPLQKEQGIEVDRSYIMHKELQVSQWITGGEQWTVFLDNSGDNIQWLLDQGCKFSAVSDGEGVAEYPVIHFWQNKKAAEGCFPFLQEKADSYGVEIRTSTPFDGLILENGVVVGAYAKNESGEDIQINAKAVILATGSYSGNEEYCRERGWSLDGVTLDSTIYNADGIRAAINEAGARSFVPYATFNATNHLGNFYYQDMFTYHAMSNPGDALFVNENAARFIYETYAEENYMVQCVPNLTQKKIFSVFDRATMEKWANNDALYPIEGYTPMDLDAIDNSTDPALAVAGSIEELASKAGLDAAKLQATIDRYNENCTLGIDRDFGKTSEHLLPITTAPFYAAHITASPGVMIGGVETNIFSQVVDILKNPIEGLYAVGVDGCMLYRNIYTFDTACAGANANNINSARVAANHIAGKVA
ncbi:MAG: FAD-binding protein [Coriobacteriales bacterium]|jgi:fumarate reductase flavoprotein subunit|nr:FAD-binding protein [Coriobacteriales bacterium]